MESLTKSQKARNAVRAIKTIIDALALRGFYKPLGDSGRTLADALRMLSPEIYGSMTDSRIIELKGLEYVLDRLPMGVEVCNRIVLTAQEEFVDTSFELIVPPKRRRACYRIGEKEMCFVITRGYSEIYDLLTHITFLNNEAEKLFRQMHDRNGEIALEWKRLEATVAESRDLSPSELDKALWNLSILLGRTMHETKETHEYLERYATADRKLVFFNIVLSLGRRVAEEQASQEDELLVTFTPSLQEILGNQIYSRKWAGDIKRRLVELGFEARPLHIISANPHSIRNLIYGYTALCGAGPDRQCMNVFEHIAKSRDDNPRIREFALSRGFYELPDQSGTHIDCQIIDTAKIGDLTFHPDLHFNTQWPEGRAPVIFVMDYAFGIQAFETMDELLEPYQDNKGREVRFDIRSISVMGKAGTLNGKKGDIMLATAHVMEGTSGNYIFENDLTREDFKTDIPVYVGPMVTVVGTSLQNRDLLQRFQSSSWKAVGLEMEGSHYQKAIGSAMIREHIPRNVKVRYAYYASDNPLESGQTLASGSMGKEGIKPTYLITQIILEKILNPDIP